MGNQKVKDSLPWWVELLFVQIGLPDSLLRSFLKGRKTTSVYINTNKRSILLTLSSIAVLLYINPLIEQSKNHNRCIRNSEGIANEIFNSKNNLFSCIF